MKTIPALEARVHLGEIMNRSFKKGERFIVEKSGIPMIAIMSAQEYTRIVEEREERFKIMDALKSRLPDIPSQEIEEDVEKTIQILRKKRV